MGWSSDNMRGNVKNWYKDQFNYENSDYELIDCALVQRQTMYGAVKQKSTGEVFCSVMLVRWGRGYYNFSYKDMSEFSGPNVIDCPERIFKLLSPLNDTNDPNKWARQWRAKVMYYIAKRKQLLGNVTFETKEPVQFTSGNEYKYFKKTGRKMYGGNLFNGIFVASQRVRFNPLHSEFKII